MFGSVVTALALAASVSQVAAGPVRHVARGYAQDADILEDYTPYHVRYLALGCSGGHGSEFFEECCHPLLRWQKLEDRPARCIPSASASSSAVLAEPTASPIDVDPIYDDEDCEDDTTTYVAPPTTYQAEPTKLASSRMVTSTTKEAEPTSTKKPPTTTKEAEPTKAPSTGGNEITGGFATFYSQGGNAGACGEKHSDDDLIVAIDYRRYGDINSKSDLCDKAVYITNPKNGRSVQANIKDVCPTCKNSNSIDLSKGTFKALEDDFGVGMFEITWHFV